MEFTSKCCICLIVLVALIVSSTLGAPKKLTKTKLNDERIAALYVKDAESGDLRFLTGASNTGVNTALNQFITQSQNALEQLRPNTGFNTGLNGLTGINTGNLGTLGTLGTGTGLSGVNGIGGITGFNNGFGTTGTNGVTPIIISLGNGGTATGTNSGLSGAIAGTSPIGDLLPQIISQAVINQRRNPNAIRRRVRPGNNQIYVVRPGRQ